MPLDQRFSRLMSSLTARDRAALAFKAHHDGAEMDPDVLGSMPQWQAREYDRYVGVGFVAHYQLGTILHGLAAQVYALDDCVAKILLLEEAATILETQYAEQVNEDLVRAWRKQKDVTVPLFLRGLSHEVKQGLLYRVRLCWQELQALEIVWQEIYAMVDLPDGRNSELRELAKDTHAQLVQLNASLSGKRKRRLPLPDEAIVDEVRRLADDAFEFMHLQERLR